LLLLCALLLPGAHARQQGDSAHDAKGVQARQYYEAHEVTYNKHLKAALADLKIVVQNPCKGAQDIAPEIMRVSAATAKGGGVGVTSSFF
jgi:hypothetical protein